MEGMHDCCLETAFVKNIRSSFIKPFQIFRLQRPVGGCPGRNSVPCIRLACPLWPTSRPRDAIRGVTARAAAPLCPSPTMKHYWCSEHGVARSTGLGPATPSPPSSFTHSRPDKGHNRLSRLPLLLLLLAPPDALSATPQRG